MGGAGAGAHASLAMLKKREDEDEDDDDLSKAGTLAKLSMLTTFFDFGCYTHTLPPEANQDVGGSLQYAGARAQTTP